MIPRGFTWPVACAIGCGLAVGAAWHALGPPPDPGMEAAGLAASAVRVGADVLAGTAELFLRLLRYLVAPLVFVSIVAGIGGMDEPAAVRRIGWRLAAWCAACSLVAAVAGLLAARLLPGAPAPGSAWPAPPVFALGPLALPTPDLSADARWLAAAFGAFPRAAEPLSMAVLAVAFGGVVVAARGVLPGSMLALAEEATLVLLALTRRLMRLSPGVTFVATAAVTARHGIAVVRLYGELVGGSLLALGLLAGLLVVLAFSVLGGRTWPLLRALRRPVAIGFATASSEEAYPGLIEQLDGLGVPSRVSGMVLALGFAFNPCGSIAYVCFVALFLAPACGPGGAAPGPAGTLAILALVLLLARGLAGVPRAALLVLATVLPALGLPPEAMLPLLGIDAFVDMGRSAVNVLGHGLAAAVSHRSVRPCALAPLDLASGGPAGAIPTALAPRSV